MNQKSHHAPARKTHHIADIYSGLYSSNARARHHHCRGRGARDGARAAAARAPADRTDAGGQGALSRWGDLIQTIDRRRMRACSVAVDRASPDPAHQQRGDDYADDACAIDLDRRSLAFRRPCPAGAIARWGSPARAHLCPGADNDPGSPQRMRVGRPVLQRWRRILHRRQGHASLRSGKVGARRSYRRLPRCDLRHEMILGGGAPSRDPLAPIRATRHASPRAARETCRSPRRSSAVSWSSAAGGRSPVGQPAACGHSKTAAWKMEKFAVADDGGVSISDHDPTACVRR